MFESRQKKENRIHPSFGRLFSMGITKRVQKQYTPSFPNKSYNRDDLKCTGLCNQLLKLRLLSILGLHSRGCQPVSLGYELS